MKNLALLVISLLDDEHGISSESMAALDIVLNQYGMNDLTEFIIPFEGRWYLSVDEADRLRKKISCL